MSMKVKMQTYVAFIVPHQSAPQKGVPVPFAVESRNLQDLDVPREACAFYFYDAPAHLSAQESLHDKHSPSKEYLLAHETLSRHDIKTLLAGANYPSLDGRMQWDARVEKYDTFVITRNNSVHPVTENHIVINSKMQQIYPAAPVSHDSTVDPDQLASLFNPVLQKDVLVPRMPDVRRRAGGHKPPPR